VADTEGVKVLRDFLSKESWQVFNTFQIQFILVDDQSFEIALVPQRPQDNIHIFVVQIVMIEAEPL